MVRVNILDTEISNFFETQLYDEGISAIEYYLLLNLPDEINIPGAAHIRLLISLAVVPEAHLMSTAGNTKSQQASLAARAITVLNLIKDLAKENNHVQEVLFKAIKLPVSGDRSGRHRSRRADPEFTNYIPSSYLAGYEEGHENGSNVKKRKDTHVDKKITPRKRKKVDKLDLLIFSDEKEDEEDDDEGNEYTDRALSIDPDQVLFTWPRHTKSWDLIEWILLYSTVSTDFHRNRFRQLRPVLLFLLDLFTTFDRGLQMLTEMLLQTPAVLRVIFCHWTDNRFEHLCNVFEKYLSNFERETSPEKLIPSVDLLADTTSPAARRTTDGYDELNLLHSIDIRLALLTCVQKCLQANPVPSALRNFQHECLPYLQRLSFSCKSAMDPDPLIFSMWTSRYRLPFDTKRPDDLTNDLILILSSAPKVGKRAPSKHFLQEYCLAIQYFLSYHIEFLASAGTEFSGVFIDAHKRGKIVRAKLVEEYTLGAVEAEECVRMEKTIHATLASFAVV
ncbi:hypothetical protein D0Z00_004104 [Geotrichum galactomycetum]|uniref:Uncharacterized protein n=1 Tax=Geotrichum galactomycetum TaxID=27317 RepID=A0ACB6UZE6_9ASCO|nr:hypothetical protein D0Z00_004104 [Geotrichum candidum]